MRKLAALLFGAAVCINLPAQADQRAAAGFAATQNAKTNLRHAQQIINAYRRSRGLAPLTLDARLTAAAQAHASDMARHDTMSHTVSYGGLPRRMALAGLRPRLAAENVSVGYRTASRAIAGWQRSAAHNRNLLMPAVSHMGLAVAYQPQSRYKYYWTLILAAE